MLPDTVHIKCDGFTIYELILAIVIIGITSTWAGFGIKRFLAEKKLERDVVLFHRELVALRAKALKTQFRYIVSLNNTSYTIYKDVDNDAVVDIPGDDTIPSQFLAPIALGLPSTKPSSRPGGISGAPENAIEGNWGNGIQFEGDRSGTINTGRIYLTANALPVCYCVSVQTTEYAIKLYKWTGSAWITL
ncbi:MAG: type II secretion system protein [Chitinivibrionales bacterium]|nr:type II secretion system protein [Chitinivibrionales bacterium]